MLDLIEKRLPCSIAEWTKIEKMHYAKVEFSNTFRSKMSLTVNRKFYLLVATKASTNRDQPYPPNVVRAKHINDLIKKRKANPGIAKIGNDASRHTGSYTVQELKQNEATLEVLANEADDDIEDIKNPGTPLNHDSTTVHEENRETIDVMSIENNDDIEDIERPDTLINHVTAVPVVNTMPHAAASLTNNVTTEPNDNTAVVNHQYLDDNSVRTTWKRPTILPPVNGDLGDYLDWKRELMMWDELEEREDKKIKKMRREVEWQRHEEEAIMRHEELKMRHEEAKMRHEEFKMQHEEMKRKHQKAMMQLVEAVSMVTKQN
jgi:hypothetical protein